MLIDRLTLYDILGVKPDAPAEKIRAIYRLKTREVHPDFNHGNQEPQKQLNLANEILSDPDKRREYNEQMGLPIKPRRIKAGKPTYQEISISPQRADQLIPYTFTRWEPCTRCWGEGCYGCQGKGKIQEAVRLTVTIPAGVSQVVVEGQGTMTEPGGSRGDLILYVIWQ
jgi:DnaJ-class molecular chaperone